MMKNSFFSVFFSKDIFSNEGKEAAQRLPTMTFLSERQKIYVREMLVAVQNKFSPNEKRV